MTTTAQPAAPFARLGYIDALRGVAALGVVATHCLVIFRELPWHFSAVIAQGRHGVQLFFILSAITLLRSWRRRSPSLQSPIRAFFVRRVFRIAPLFWIAALFYTILATQWHPFWFDVTITPLAFFLTLFFAHGWLPWTINSVVPGGWSIAAEMTFYVLFPGLVAVVSSLRRAILFAALTYALCFAASIGADHLFPIADTVSNRFFAYVWLPNQVLAFAFGFVAYHVLPILPRRRGIGTGLVWFAGMSIVATASWPLPFNVSWNHPLTRDLVACTSSLALVLGLAAWPSKALVNRFFCHAGRISFSVYIWHWVPVEVARSSIGPIKAAGLAGVFYYGLIFVAVTAASLLIADVSFRIIEQPMIRLGNRIADRHQAPAAV